MEARVKGGGVRPFVVSPRSQSIFVQFAAFKFQRDTDEFGPASRDMRRPRRAWKSLLTIKPFVLVTRKSHVSNTDKDNIGCSADG